MIIGPAPGRRTLLTEAYLTLRSAIINRRIALGAKLIVREIAEQLQLSPTPIKGALSALEREGLVVAVPHRGYFVPTISLDDIGEIYALREVVDGLAARLAAGRTNAVLGERLKSLIGRQKKVAPGDFERYGDLDLEFHRCIREASRSGRLLRTAEAFDGQIRLLIGTSAKARKVSTSIKEHEAIANAIMRTDPHTAEAAMRHHVREAGQALKTLFQEAGVPAGIHDAKPTPAT